MSDLLEPELDDGDTLAPDPEHPLAGFELLMANYCKPTSESMSQKADNEKRLARVSDEQTVADTVPERPQRVPERRAAQAKGKGKVASRRLAISSRGHSEKTSNGAALRQTVARVTEDNGKLVLLRVSECCMLGIIRTWAGQERFKDVFAVGVTETFFTHARFLPLESIL